MKKLFAILCLISVLFLGYTSFSEAKSKKLVRDIDITVSDNLVINATIFLAPNSSVKAKSPFAILLPSLGGNKKSYESLAKKLSESGIAAITINPRGHSLSCNKTNGKKIFWQSMSNNQYAKYPADIAEIIDFIKKNYLAVDSENYVIVASDVTANASIIFSSTAKPQPKKLILFSPSISFKGLNSAIPMVNYGKHPVIVFVSKSDTASYKNALELKKYAQGDYKIIELPSGGTGDYLMKIYSDIEPAILRSIQETLLK